MSAARNYSPREYMVVKVKGYYLVLSPDIEDPDVWALINYFCSAADAWAYVRGVQALHRQMVEAVGFSTTTERGCVPSQDSRDVVRLAT